MANHDYDLADQSGAAFLADINSCLEAIRTNNSGSSDPPGSGSGFQFQWYADTGDNTLKIRNANGDGFVNVSTVGGIGLENFGLATAASPTFTGTASFGGNVKMTGTGTLDLPAGTTGQRPASPNTGMIRFNTSNNAYEGYSGSEWKHLDGDQTPAGTIIYTARATAPPGYIKADGAQYTKSEQPSLYAAIEQIYGGGDDANNQTNPTFLVPDLRGEFIRGLDNGRGRDTEQNRALGSTQDDQNKDHNHGASTNTDGSHGHSVSGSTDDDTHSHGAPGSNEEFQLANRSDNNNVSNEHGSDDSDQGDFDEGYATSTATETHNHTISVSASASGSDHSHGIPSDGGTEARPRNIALLACIKT